MVDTDVVETPKTGGSQLHSTKVNKHLEVEVDLGHLLASDPNEVNLKELRSGNPDKYLQNLARDNTQVLFNKIWTLPFERVDDVVVTKLPKPEYILPREKRVPKGDNLTKWQAYAKEKGITKKKKTKLVWDELVNQWVPRYGYRRAAAEHEKDWVLEVPQNADPYEDQFEKRTEAKSERVAKNELQRLKNIARSRKVEVPSTGLLPNERPSKDELHQAAVVAKVATASLGKFQKKLPDEKPLKNSGKKRKFESVNQDHGAEKSKNLDVLDKILNKKPLLDVEKAVNRHVSTNFAAADDNDDDDGGSKKQKRGGKANKPQKNSKIKKGPARKGSFKKGRAAPRSKPKKKKH